MPVAGARGGATRVTEISDTSTSVASWARRGEGGNQHIAATSRAAHFCTHAVRSVDRPRRLGDRVILSISGSDAAF